MLHSKSVMAKYFQYLDIKSNTLWKKKAASAWKKKKELGFYRLAASDGLASVASPFTKANAHGREETRNKEESK